MKLLVVLGAIGAGKSTAVEIIKTYLDEKGEDCLRLHLDDLAREVISADSKILEELKDAFGPYVVSVEGELNRQALALVAFRTPESVQSLNEITHPAVIARIGEILDEYRLKQPGGFVICESPYPFGLEKYDPVTLYIYADYETRAAHNDRFLATDFEARNRVQPTEASYRSSSDFEIENTFEESLFSEALKSFVDEHLL